MKLFRRPEPGPKLAALLEARQPIEALYEPWVQGERIDPAMLRRLHDKATIAAHDFYVDSIPIYTKLAEELGLVDCDDPAMIIAEMARSPSQASGWLGAWPRHACVRSMTRVRASLASTSRKSLIR